jgi:hypothetical protein
MSDASSSDFIERALERVFDQALVFHGFADFTRDYDVYAYCTADQQTGIQPETLRLRFKHCVRAHVATAVTPGTWAQSLDERLIDYDQGVDLDGFVWGVKWQCLYPGGRLVSDSTEAAAWSENVGIEFHEVSIETNAQTIALVFSGFEMTKVDPGESPFTVTGEGPDFKVPLP